MDEADSTFGEREIAREKERDQSTLWATRGWEFPTAWLMWFRLGGGGVTEETRHWTDRRSDLVLWIRTPEDIKWAALCLYNPFKLIKGG